MPHYGTLRDFSFQTDIDDVRGTALYGLNDEKLGKIDDVIFDHATGEIRFVVVDTGGWFKHKKFLVPADRIHAYDKDNDAFQVDLLKDEIERKFPKYDENTVRSEKEWADFEAEYRRVWEQDPVLHRKDRIDLEVTPSEIPNEPPARPSDEELAREDQSGAFTPTRLAGKFPATAESADKIDMVPAGFGTTGLENKNEFPLEANPPANPTQQSKGQADVGQWHPRMKSFEDVLRKNRVDVTASCPSCKPAKDRAA
jgi:sporulation protein YlmC with PRC-barrel domain